MNRNSEVISIPSGLNRASRFPFAASIELADVRSERLVTARTTNLSLFGCYVSTAEPFAEGTKVSRRIMHGGASLAALGWVVHSKPNAGMGVASTTIEPPSQAILEKWLASLRKEWLDAASEMLCARDRIWQVMVSSL
jgi:hypothetical protein